MKRDRRLLKKEPIVMFILSLVFFSEIDVDGMQYLLIVSALWALIFNKYKFSVNLHFYKSNSLLAFVNVAVYFFSKLVIRGYPLKNVPGIWLSLTIDARLLILYCGALVVFIFYCHYKIYFDERLKTETVEKIDLFQERKDDVKKIIQYLKRFSMIGIEGSWGSGKTVLMDHVVSDDSLSDDYIFVTIHLLSIDFDNIADIIIREIGKALETEGIASSGIPELRKWMKSDGWFGRFFSLFLPDGSTYTDAMSNLKKDLERLNGRRIVVVYEDIDRVNNAENVRRLFSLSENLTGARIKFIYEFDAISLQHLDKQFSREYVEKYIPHIIRLTPISVEHMFENAIDEEGLQNVDMDDLKFIFREVPVDRCLQKGADAPPGLNLNLHEPSVRVVHGFLEELDDALAKEEFKKKTNRQVTVTYYLWKWFFYDFYRKIDFDSILSPFEQMQFNTVMYINTVDKDSLSENQAKTTLMQILRAGEAEKRVESRNVASESAPDFDGTSSANGMSMDDMDIAILSVDKKMGIWDDEENRINLLILSMLGYHFDANEPIALRGDISAIVNEDPRNLEKRIRNEEIDRLLRKLDYNGKSGVTDQEFICCRMCEDVLAKPKDEWMSAFDSLWKDFYKGTYKYNDNYTVFKLGISYLLQLFKAFSVSHPREADWIKLLEFYFNQCRTDTYEENNKTSNWKITARVLQPLNYVELNHRKVYIAVLKEFNRAEIIGNLNHSRTYRIFVDKYLNAISLLGFTETFECEYIRLFSDHLDEELDTLVFDKIENRLKELKNKLAFSKENVKDINTVIDFIEKNRELYKTEQSAPIESNHPRVEVKSSGRFRNQETVDLIKMEYFACEHPDLAGFQEAIQKEYEAGKLIPYEMGKLVDEFNKTSADIQSKS